MPLILQKILQRQRFQRGLIHQRLLVRALLLCLEDEAGGQGVPVHALVAVVRAGPEPAVLAVLDGGDEVFAYFLGGGFGVAVFGEDDLLEFRCCSLLPVRYDCPPPYLNRQWYIANGVELERAGWWAGEGGTWTREKKHTLIPLGHIILLLLLLLRLLLGVPRISIQTPLLTLPLNRQIMTELALLPLLTIPRLEKQAQHSLWIDAEGDFLRLDGFEEICGFLSGRFGGGFFLLTLGFFCGLALFFWCCAGCLLGFNMGDLFLGCSAFFLL